MIDHWDIVVVGAGISGAFATWRLKQALPEKRILLVEASGRLGGRLWSLEAPGIPGPIMEIGGATYSQQHALVHRLVTQLGLETIQVAPDKTYFASFVRGTRLSQQQLMQGQDLPYRLAEGEKGQFPFVLMQNAILSALPGLEALMPMTGENRDAVIDFLRAARVGGRPLTQLGFWTMISDRVSGEAFDLIRDTFGHPTALSNGNAYNLLIHYLASATGPNLKIKRGYQSLVTSLLDQAIEAGVTVRTRHMVDQVTMAGEGHLTLSCQTDAETLQTTAGQVLLALPPAALRQIRVSAPAGLLAWPDELDAVLPLPATKLFVTYPTPWWQDLPNGPGQIAPDSYAVTTTSLPACSCSYLGTAQFGAEGPALIMGAYGDGGLVQYWEGLSPSTLQPKRERACHHDSLADLEAPRDMILHLHRQLEAMHGRPLPPPMAGYYQDWSLPPYGAGYHSWRPFAESWTYSARLRTPFAGLPLTVCGEAYADLQGWVEGALMDTNTALQESFGLSPY